MAGAELEVLDELDDGFEEEIAGEDEGEDEQAVEGMHEKDDAGEDVDGSDEEFPDAASCGVGLEGKDKVGDSAEDHGPAEEEGDRDAGDRRDHDGEEAGEDEKDAEGDRPVDGFGGQGGKRGGGG